MVVVGGPCAAADDKVEAMRQAKKPIWSLTSGSLTLVPTYRCPVAHSGRGQSTGIPLIDGHYRVRHDKIDLNGKLTTTAAYTPSASAAATPAHPSSYSCTTSTSAS